MRIVARSTIVDFYNKHIKSKTALEEWFEKSHNAKWRCFADVKKTFNSVDSIGNKRYVFNIKGNDYRLIALILFKPQTVYIRHICTHKDYDKVIDCSIL